MTDLFEFLAKAFVLVVELRLLFAGALDLGVEARSCGSAGLLRVSGSLPCAEYFIELGLETGAFLLHGGLLFAEGFAFGLELYELFGLFLSEFLLEAGELVAALGDLLLLEGFLLLLKVGEGFLGGEFGFGLVLFGLQLGFGEQFFGFGLVGLIWALLLLPNRK